MRTATAKTVTATTHQEAKSKQFESLQEAAARIGVHTKTLRRWIAAGKLTAYRPSARVIRLDVAEVDAYMDATATNRWEVA